MTDPDAPTLVGLADVPGVAQGLAVAADTVVTLPSGSTATVNPLLAISSVDGLVYLYDGAALLPVDAGSGGVPLVASFYLLEPDGSRKDDPVDGPQLKDGSGTSIVGLVHGKVRQEQLEVTWQGAMARGRAGVPVPGGLTDEAFDFGALGVVAGDRVTFEDAPACGSATAATVETVSGHQLGLDGFDTSCLPVLARYAVRAPGTFVVRGTRSGYLGRLPPGQSFDGAGVSFVMGKGEPDIATDASYVLVLTTGIAQFYLPLGSATSGLAMPGAMAFDPVRKLFYAAYIGGNAVVEIDPTAVRQGETDLGLAIFH